MAVLLMEGELCVCDLTAVLDLPQPSVSRHMSVLRSAGLVVDRREGRWVHYKLANPLPLGQLRGCLSDLAGEEPYYDDLARLREHHKTGKCQS